MVAWSAAIRSADARHDGDRPRRPRDLREEHVQYGFFRPCGVRARERAARDGDRGSPLVPRPEWIRRAAGRAAARWADVAVRRRLRSVRRAAHLGDARAW